MLKHNKPYLYINTILKGGYNPWGCPRPQIKSTNRSSDFCHVRRISYVVWASRFTGPIAFRIKKSVKPVSRLSSLSSFREELTLIFQNRSSIPFLFLFFVSYVNESFIANIQFSPHSPKLFNLIDGFFSLSPSEILYRSLNRCFICIKNYSILSTAHCDEVIRCFRLSETNGEAAVPPSPVKPVAQTGVSYGNVNPMKSKGVTVETKNPIKPIGKTGASSGLNLGVRGRASVSSGAKGKAIVSDNAGKVITFKDVTFGPHEDEVRFRLIHFWEAWNVQTKVLIGLEMLLIDEEV